MTLKLGAIADDYTGATDLAVTLVKGGMQVLQVFGVPTQPVDLTGIDAVVLALKSRTAPVAEAVAASQQGCAWLRTQGARQIFFKYCSTFDSTDTGNIGPVADALAEMLSARLAFVCPAFPINQRSVYMGHLFVGDRLLADSPMKDHPLTPMRDSDLVRLMGAQSQHPVGLIPLSTVRRGAAAITAAAGGLVHDGARYAVVDAVEDNDLRAIGQAARDHPLITGGSGLAIGLPANFGHKPGATAQHMPRVFGRSAVLAGSCSTATQAQIEHVRHVWPSLKLDLTRLENGDDLAREAVDWAAGQSADAPVLIYASSPSEDVAATQARYGRDAAGAMIEALMAEIARGLKEHGFRRLVVAGGETSGAVVDGLGVRGLRIGAEIDPGVPWTETLDDIPLALALKSGNFGGTDFFRKAFEMLP